VVEDVNAVSLGAGKGGLPQTKKFGEKEGETPGGNSLAARGVGFLTLGTEIMVEKKLKGRGRSRLCPTVALQKQRGSERREGVQRRGGRKKNLWGGKGGGSEADLCEKGFVLAAARIGEKRKKSLEMEPQEASARNASQEPEKELPEMVVGALGRWKKHYIRKSKPAKKKITSNGKQLRI